MKKIYARVIIITLTVLWAVRYYIINDGFAVHGNYPEKVYLMHETIEYNDCKSYNMYEQPGYSISLESARIIDSETYIKEIGSNAENYDYLSEKYLELTLTISNNGDYPDGIAFYGLPVIGENWYAFYDEQITASINDFFVENNVTFAERCGVRKGNSATVKIAYNLYENMFLPKQWNNLTNEKMWLWVTQSPVDQRIAIIVN
ncbi:MAG: hypothetical protein NC320_07290 [Clostridium sp.]|nr:hypothetical protein [Clostridium sp.]